MSNMEVGIFLLGLVKSPEVQSFLISCGASATWEALKAAFVNRERIESSEAQAFCVVRDTFRVFYQKNQLEFDEEIVMDAFLEATKSTQDLKEKLITKKILSETLGYKVKERELKEWTATFIQVCSNPRYQWVYNELTFSVRKPQDDDKDRTWMEEVMKGNFCKIQCDMVDELQVIFGNVTTDLPGRCWYDVRVLVVEIVRNAQEHGDAQNCVVIIHENSIEIVNDGTQFNVLALETQKMQRGGCMALKKFKSRYSKVSLDYEFDGICNHFTMKFNRDVFNVNGMSEIRVPNLANNVKIQFKYPKGEFRYYFIDVDEIAEKDVFATFSGVFSLLHELTRKFENKAEAEKLFIYCSNTEREDYEYVCITMIDVLQAWETKNFKVKVELIGDMWEELIEQKDMIKLFL